MNPNINADFVLPSLSGLFVFSKTRFEYNACIAEMTWDGGKLAGLPGFTTFNLLGNLGCEPIKGNPKIAGI